MTKPPLRVAYVTWSAARDRILNALVDYSDSGRVEYSVIVLARQPGPVYPDMSSRSVAVRSLGLRRVSLEQVPFAAARLRRILRGRQLDVVHSVLFYPALAVELARATMPTPPPSLLARHHEMRLHLDGKHLHVRLDRWMARHATRVVAVSEAVRRVLTQHEKVPRNHVDVILNGLDWQTTVGVDSTGVDHWRRQFGEHRLLVAAGRLDSQKDYPTLLRAVAHVVGSHPDVHLAIAGVGPREAELKDLVAQLGLARSVSFLGWIHDVYDLMAAADVFVQSSVDEACPQTIIEAAGLGVPVVTTTVGGVPEILGDAVGRIDAGDDEALAARLRSTLDEPGAHRSHAKAIAPTVRSKFDARDMAQAYAGTYERLGVTGSDGSSRGHW